MVYEGGEKRYQDEIFAFDGHNGIILLENGGGKTVFLQVALQAVLPHVELAERKILNTLSLSGGPAHIAIEWILNDKPRRYGLTAVTLFLDNQGRVDTYRYAYEYAERNENSIEHMPFVQKNKDGSIRASDRGEINEYYKSMSVSQIAAYQFETIKQYQSYLEDSFKIISTEWESIAHINSAEGDVDAFFDAGRSTAQLVEQLLIPTVERTIPGKGSADFVENFQKQREHFRQHKILREKISECQRIETELETLTVDFEANDQSYLEQEKHKRFAKAVMENTDKECQTVTQKLEEIKIQLETLDSDDKSILRIKSSVETKNLELLVNQFRDVYFNQKAELSLVEMADAKESKYIAELQLTMDEKDLKEHKAAILHYDKELRVQETDPAYEKVLEDIGIIGGQLKGSYFDFFSECETLIKSHQRDKKIEENRLKDINAQCETHESQRLHYNSELASEKREMAICSDEMDKIGKEHIPLYPEESVSHMREVWQERSKYLNKIMIQNNQQLKQLQEKLSKLEAEQYEVHNQNDALIITLTQTEAFIQQFDKTELLIKEKLGKIRFDWANFPVHQKQDSLKDALNNRLDKVEKDLDKLREEEQTAAYWNEAYSNSGYYTADPHIEVILNRLGTQFSTLVSGPAFLSLYKKTPKIDEVTSEMSLWAMAVIAAEEEVESVRDRLMTINDELRGPVYLLSERQGLSIIENGTEAVGKLPLILPQLWADNMVSENFESWKFKLNEDCVAFKKQRVSLDSMRLGLLSTMDVLKSFIEQYPWRLVEENRSKYEEYLGAQKQLAYKLEINQIEQKNNRESIQNIQNYLADYDKENNDITYRLKDVERYQSLERKRKKAETNYNELSEQLRRVEHVLKNLGKQIETIKDNIQDFDEQIRDRQYRLEMAQNEDLWKAVESYEVLKKSHENLAILKIEWKRLQDKINNRQAGRVTLLEFKQKVEQDKERCQNRIDQMLTEVMSYGLREVFDFPIDGLKLLEKGKLKHKQYEKDILEQRSQCDKESRKYDNTMGKLEYAQSNHYRYWLDNYTLPDAIENMSDWLQAEETRIRSSRLEIEREKQNYQKNLAKLSLLMRAFELKDVAFKFCSPNVKVELLDEVSLMELPYKREFMVNKCLKRLEDGDTQIQIMSKRLADSKQAFQVYCHRNVTDAKLRELTVSGIVGITTYGELMVWRENISKTLRHVIRLAEDDLIEHDKQLTTFVGHMHSHLLIVAVDLRKIPRSTRVKQSDQWKEIYSFVIPEWDENEGNEKLRSHLDKLLDELDATRFAVDGSVSKETEIRKHIERNLQTKQLLGILTNRKPYQVKCRKVSNDGTVSEGFFTWEESNQWSGGEKWSKNMALFLGILNYVAEKRMLLEGPALRQRVVLLDNPFGKASSDHVLRPVFYIAQQLGFQIIALTAHNDGRFIRDYFPVVYSCRLKHLVGSKNKAVKKDQQISQAWFMEHDPEAIMRLGEQKQITIFDQ